MKRLVLISSFLFCLAANAQQNIFMQNEIMSPVVNADHSVTINYFNPNAKSVEVSGDFLDKQKVQTQFGVQEVDGTISLTKNDNGLWTYTSQPLAPELYSYTLSVDGQRVLDPSNVYMNRDIANYSNIFIISHEKGDKGYLYSVNDVPHGDVARVWYDSPTLGMQRRMTIYTPAGYASSKEKLPVMYLLHGAGGDEEAWPAQGRAAQILDNLIALGKTKPMIVVMTNGNTDCAAAPGEWAAGMYKPSFTGRGGQSKADMDESFKDVMSYVESHYRILPGKKNHAVCGLSMGGLHTYQISKMYPDTFDYIGLFSALIQLSPAPLHGGAEAFSNTTVDDKVAQQLAQLFAAKPTLYWIAIGKTDFLYQNNEIYRKYLDSKNYKYEYVETEEGHIWRNWRDYLTIFSQRCFK